MAHSAQIVFSGKKFRNWYMPKRRKRRALKKQHKRRLRRMAKDVALPTAALQINRYVN